MTSLSPHQSQLREQGFVVLQDFIPASVLEELRYEFDRLVAEEGERAGIEFRQEPGCVRLANLADKADVFRRLFVMPQLLEWIRFVLGPNIKLSSLNGRSSVRDVPKQVLHADMGGIPDAHGPWVCNSIWMLDDFTPDNGTLRVVPGSHRFGKLPQDALEDPLATHPKEEIVTGRAGSVAIFNAHAWHGALTNTSGAPRRAVHVFFARRDKPQQQHQKMLLRAETQEHLSTEQREILALDDSLNDELTASDPGRSGLLL